MLAGEWSAAGAYLAFRLLLLSAHLLVSDCDLPEDVRWNGWHLWCSRPLSVEQSRICRSFFSVHDHVGVTGHELGERVAPAQVASTAIACWPGFSFRQAAPIDRR